MDVSRGETTNAGKWCSVMMPVLHGFFGKSAVSGNLVALSARQVKRRPLIPVPVFVGDPTVMRKP